MKQIQNLFFSLIMIVSARKQKQNYGKRHKTHFSGVEKTKWLDFANKNPSDIFNFNTRHISGIKSWMDKPYNSNNYFLWKSY